MDLVDTMFLMVHYCTVSYSAVIVVGFLSGGTQGTDPLPYCTGTSSCTGGGAWTEYCSDPIGGEVGWDDEEVRTAYAEKWAQFNRFSRVAGGPVKFRRVESSRAREFRRWMFRSRATMY